MRGQLYGFADQVLTQCMWVLPVRLSLTIFIEALLLPTGCEAYGMLFTESVTNRPKYFSWKSTPCAHYWFGQVPSCLTPTAQKEHCSLHYTQK